MPGSEAGLNIGSHLDRDHAVRVRRRLAAHDLVDMLHPVDDAAIDGILAVQEMVVLEIDEELAVGAVSSSSAQHPACHGHAAGANSAGRSGRSELARARTAGIVVVFHIGMFHVAGLRHEAVDDAGGRPRCRISRRAPVPSSVRHVWGHVGQKPITTGPSLQPDDDGVFGILISAMGVLLGGMSRAD